MRSLCLILIITFGCVLLGSAVVPAQPQQLAQPDYPWRNTVDGWVKATWLPKELPMPAEPLAQTNPVPVPHPLFLVALQVLAIAYAAVAEWPDRQRKASAA